MTEPRTRSWMPPIPAPLQRLFDHFPLTTYPPNELPARSPPPSSLPTLYVFASAEDAARGRPSFNPSCLKWQTLLRLAHLPHTLAPSTNHASPTGSLPFLLPPTTTTTPSPRPIPASNLEPYLHTLLPSAPITPSSALPRTAHPAYAALLHTSVRAAWLTALYLDARNTPLLAALYAAPASSSRLVRAALLRQLRAAAEAEVRRVHAPASADSTGGWRPYLGLADGEGEVEREEVYAAAARAFESLARLLAESATGWFFGVEEPGVFDAAVFAYTALVAVAGDGDVEGLGLRWGDGGRLDGLVRRAGDGELVGHRRRVWELGWGTDGEGKRE